MEKTKPSDILSLRHPSERFLVLNEVFDMLAAKGLQPANLFKSLLKAYSCELLFEFGTISIMLERKTIERYVSEEDEDNFGEDVIEISVNVERHRASKSITYQYRPNELFALVHLNNNINQTAKIVKQRRPKTNLVNTSSCDKSTIKKSTKVIRYLRRTNKFESISGVSRKLGMAYQSTIKILILLEVLGLVEYLNEKHGKTTYRFVKLTQEAKRLNKIRKVS
jgi:hypothetical protein